MAAALTAIFQTKSMRRSGPSLRSSYPTKDNHKLFKNNRTISHSRKVDQAGFKAGRRTVEQIFNCRAISEKHLQVPKLPSIFRKLSIAFGMMAYGRL
ncbi:hypothetical protein DPMN_064104 [Dreissena polymorpha]|uniref:Uncharacterized protein n=1 Tax=Dreissena polymorpha TaxID=45954 RepID=A0A9D4CCU9_DREPO|nr:hypothetical protein DPMN_064104 [Dreissena polymorpha]